MAKKRSGSLSRMFGPAQLSHFVEVPSDGLLPQPEPELESAPEPEPEPAPIAEEPPPPPVVFIDTEDEPAPEEDLLPDWLNMSLNLGSRAPEDLPEPSVLQPPPALEPPPKPALAEAPTVLFTRDLDEPPAVDEPPIDTGLPSPELVRDPRGRGQLLLRYIDEDAPVEELIFSGALLPGAKLRAAGLRGVILQDADLSGADLRGADLRGADLQDTRLQGADLRGADLREALLGAANLKDADLRFADLAGVSLGNVADLRGADLRGADLAGADVTEAMRGARVDEQTHYRSRWSTVHLVAAQACGVVVDGIERLPPEVRQELAGAQEGLTLTFSTPLNFMDQYILRGGICSVLGADAACTLQIREREHGGEVRLLAPQAELTEIAESLHGRAWERAPEGDEERALIRRLFDVFPHTRLINELSALVDRLEQITLRHPNGTMSWRPPVDPDGALQHLLLKLFIPVELRWWLGCVPGGKQLVRELPGTSATAEAVVAAAIRALKRRERIDAALFTSLIEERRRRESEIRAVARLWGVEWYALRDPDQDDEDA